MGTRHMIGVVKGEQFRIAQYGQWDGYPEGQGTNILDFLRQTDLAALSASVDKCRFGSKEEIAAIMAQFSDGDGWMTVAQSDAFKRSPYAYLSRDTGADILQYVLDAKGEVVLTDSHEFAGDGLFCEWAYVIDLDRGTLEVYRGFHKDPAPPGERFAHLNSATAGKEYRPVHLAHAFPLRDLPSDDDFLKVLAEPEEVDA